VCPTAQAALGGVTICPDNARSGILKRGSPIDNRTDQAINVYGQTRTTPGRIANTGNLLEIDVSLADNVKEEFFCSDEIATAK